MGFVNSIKCFNCKNRILITSGWYCKYLQHPLENGYAMKCHSQRCGGYQTKMKNHSFMQEYWEVNDLIKQSDGNIKIVKKTRPQLIGFACECGFTTTKRKEINKHIKEIMKYEKNRTYNSNH